jgi:uncharacterized protein
VQGGKTASGRDEGPRTRLTWVVALTAIASLAPDIVVREATGALPGWWLPGKAAVLLVATIVLFSARAPLLAGYGLVLSAIVAGQVLEAELGAAPWWTDRFPAGTFASEIGGSIALKLVGALPVVAILLLLLGSLRASYLLPGDLRARAERIGWLGIPRGVIPWGRLAVISGVLIALGTLVLTLGTVTGFALPRNLGLLPGMLPLIVVLALANSFAEGLVYRSAILAPLREALPKDAVVLVSSTFFGVAHYYGAPSGGVGVVMSGLLGWYLARATYETRGFLAPWIVHFCQDVVIFSTFVLLVF